MFEVGDRVVCVRDKWSGRGVESRAGIACPLRKGAVYTIVGIAPQWGFSVDGDWNNNPVVFLKEVLHPNGNSGFDSNRFRNLRDISQSLRELKELAINCPALVEP